MQLELLFDPDIFVQGTAFAVKKESISDIFKLGLPQMITTTSAYEMPIIMAYNVCLPQNIISSHRGLKSNNHDYCIHFYEEDKYFSSLITKPQHWLKMLSKFKFVISPDFSQFLDMPDPIRRYHSYLNKLFAAWWQKKGLSVIPNVTWSDAKSYEYSFDGMPRNSIIAINSTGLRRNKMSKRMWLEGYKKAVEILSPIHIIRYGAKQHNEYEEISTFFNNDNYNSVHYGR